MSTPDNLARESVQPFVPPSPVTQHPSPMTDPEFNSVSPQSMATSAGLPQNPPAAPSFSASDFSFHMQTRPTTPTNHTGPSDLPSADPSRERRSRQIDKLPPKFVVETDSITADLPADSTTPVIRSAPPWLFSMFIHMLLMVMAGLFFLPNLVHRQITLEIGEVVEKGEQLEEPEFDIAVADLEKSVEPVVTPQELPLVEDPLTAPPLVDLAEPATNLSSLDFSVPDIGSALQGRDPGMKKALLAAYGGTPGTEAAVELALKWFAKNQRRDGFWNLTGPYDDGATIENKVSATAMALLAFQGAGHTHLRGDYVKTVRKGWYALMGSQKSDGDFWRGGLVQQRLYAQAQATIALCELYGMTRDEEYREPAQRAINYAVEIQDAQGGWRYEPGVGSDTSVTGWFVMALQSARMAYLEVDRSALENVARYLEAASTLDGARYGYRAREGGTLPMTAEGLLCQQYLGWGHDDPRLISGVEYLSEHPIDFRDRNVYQWYYATQVFHHMDDDSWDDWNRVLRIELPQHQVRQGRETGSWSPVGDRWGSHGGRLYTTALSTYMLEVYYRHLPIYAELGQFRNVADDVPSP